MYETLLEKYRKRYIRKDQLQRFVALGLLSEEEYQRILKEA